MSTTHAPVSKEVSPPPALANANEPLRDGGATGLHVVGIGASAGGLDALERFAAPGLAVERMLVGTFPGGAGLNLADARGTVRLALVAPARHDELAGIAIFDRNGAEMMSAPWFG